MANVSNSYNPGFIIAGPSDVYIDVQAPTSATPAVQGTNTWAGTGTYSVDTNGQPSDNGSSGFHIGLSDGPVTLNITPKFLEITADQHAAPVDAAFTQLETEIDFIVQEALLANLAKFFCSVLGTYTNVTSGANPAADFLQVGSSNTDANIFHSILLVSPDRANVGKFYVVQAYKTILMSAIQTTFHRTTKSTWKLKFKCFADVTRVYGDMVCQIVKITS